MYTEHANDLMKKRKEMMDELSTRRKEYSDYVEQHIGVSAYLCKQERRTQIQPTIKDDDGFFSLG